MIFPICDISEFFYDFFRSKQKSQKNDKKILKNHRKVIDIIAKSQKNPKKAASQFLNPVSINLKKLPQMPASRFLKIVKSPAKFQSAVSMCQFLSRGTLLYKCVISLANVRISHTTLPWPSLTPLTLSHHNQISGGHSFFKFLCIHCSFIIQIIQYSCCAWRLGCGLGTGQW